MDPNAPQTPADDAVPTGAEVEPRGADAPAEHAEPTGADVPLDDATPTVDEPTGTEPPGGETSGGETSGVGTSAADAPPSQAAAPPPEPGWRPDRLGEGYEFTDLPLDGGAHATLVAHRGQRAEDGPAAGRTVLYVHGWSDYFFQRPLAEYWAQQGAAFYAVDLRGHGRSLDLDDPEARPGYIEDLADYDAEIEAALAIIAAEHPRTRPILAGHSTGGLTLALWVHRNPGRAAALVLNSPWLEFQFDAATRRLITPWLKWRSRRTESVPIRVRFPDHYARSVLLSRGNLPYELDLKPPSSFPIYPAWISAVFAGHETVEKGLSITVPILVQMSTTSVREKDYSSAMSAADIVLDVDVLARRAPSLGTTVVIERIPGAMHDVVLSDSPVRKSAFARITRFLNGYLQR